MGVFIKRILITLFVSYIILLVLVSLFQNKLVYFPSTYMIDTPNSIGLKYESVEFLSSDSTKLFGWFIPRKGAKTTLLYLHGNGGNISNRLNSIDIFNSLDVDIFIFDYRGYGNSGGNAGEKNTYDDAMSAWKYLVKERGIKEENIVILGRSLGGAIAANLASKVKPKALILESTLTSVKDVSSDVYPFIPSFLIHFEYETTKYLKDINSPLLVIHSEDDNIIPFKHGQKIFQEANKPKRFLKIRGSHNGGFLESRDIYEKALEEFLRELD